MAFPFSWDLLNTLLLLTVAVVGTLSYLVHVHRSGRAHSARVDRQGGSALLGKAVMEGAYWCLQPVARGLVLLKITPNMISWGSLALGILAGVCLAFGHFGFGAFFAVISAFFDTLDGMVARMTEKSSDAGEVLDATVDRYVEFFFLAGLVVYYREVPYLLVMTTLAMVGSFMVSYSTAKAEALQVEAPKGAMRRPERAVYLTLGALLSPITIPMFEIYRPYGIAIGHPMVLAICLVAVMANFSAVERMVAIARSVRIREENARRTALSAEDSDPALDEESAIPAENPGRLR